MKHRTRDFAFVGSGRRTALDLNRINPWGEEIGHWIPGEDRQPEPDEAARDHPAGYVASGDLVDAVNTALLLRKPLLLTGNPGTGKSQLADRIAWEFNLGPVLRFESQSLSEAADLFYRFDLVRHVAASHASQSPAAGTVVQQEPTEFVTFGPLGKAILRSHPNAPEHSGLWAEAFPQLPLPEAGRPSVVLIDEIDKASRDFPNDLLNAIERLEVPLREVPGKVLRVAADDMLRPIIVITSNSERELPPPFLRRCVYFHIPDPSADALRMIVQRRVFPETLKDQSARSPDDRSLPPLFDEMLRFFVQQRDDRSGVLGYASGPSELIDWLRAVRQTLPAGPSGGLKEHESIVTRALGAFAKHRDDRAVLIKSLQVWSRTPASSS